MNKKCEKCSIRSAFYDKETVMSFSIAGYGTIYIISPGYSCESCNHTYTKLTDPDPMIQVKKITKHIDKSKKVQPPEAKYDQNSYQNLDNKVEKNYNKNYRTKNGISYYDYDQDWAQNIKMGCSFLCIIGFIALCYIFNGCRKDNEYESKRYETESSDEETRFRERFKKP